MKLINVGSNNHRLKELMETKISNFSSVFLF